MPDESTPEMHPTLEEPSSEGAPPDAPEVEATQPKGFLAHFPRVCIPGTDLTIRSPSVGQESATWKDLANEGVDDREFTVCVVQRQLDQDIPIEDVRAWPDEQLLAAADAYLSLRAGELGDDEEDEDDEPDDTAAEQAEGETGQVADEGKATVADHARNAVEDRTVDEEPVPLTFAAFRGEMRRQC